jgi:uncharacterized protein (DUF1499 family)
MQLQSAWREVLDNALRTKYLFDEPGKIVVVQRSMIFRFPDVIYIEFETLPDNSSTFALYSHSIYGHSDLGVNKKRVLKWIKALDQVKSIQRSYGVLPEEPSGIGL